MTTFQREPVPTWAQVTAWAVPATVLPSAVWRIVDWAHGLAYGHPCAAPGAPLWEKVYVPSLSVVSLGLALLTLGLVRPWGERVPRRVPLLGGRRVPPLAAVVPAATGAVAVGLVWGYAFRDFPRLGDFHFAHDGWRVLMVASYLPLLLWAPLLAAVTVAYYRRRCRG